jgi:hypothetical protein
LSTDVPALLRLSSASMDTRQRSHECMSTPWTSTAADDLLALRQAAAITGMSPDAARQEVQDDQ